MEYFPKINTLFKRDKETFNVIVGDYTRPEFSEISKWLINEKLDGSNISISAFIENNKFYVEWRGRTPKAQFPTWSVEHLDSLVDKWNEDLERVLRSNNLKQIEFFGEIYGPKIQSGGIYSTEIKSKFYDIRVDGRLWLPWDAVLGYRETFGYDVPYYDYEATTQEIINTVRDGFETFESGGTGGVAEGLICKTNTPLYNNAGKRLIFKLKTVDFTHGK